MALNFVNDLKKTSGQIKSDQIGLVIEQMVNQRVTQRHKHERRWYDNNYFDDGHHFKVISRKTGRVIDTIGKTAGFTERAIPRASLQIRGVSNLLFSAEPYPVVYPERVSVSEFMDVAGTVDEVRYKEKLKQAKDVASKQGIYLTTSWEDNSLDIKLIDMLILAAKNSISYLKVYTDHKGKLCYDIRDAFDIIVDGDKRSLQECSFVTDTSSSTIEEVKNNPMFDPSMTEKLVPDNKYATSEIKDAYMRSRFGTKSGRKNMRPLLLRRPLCRRY